MARIKLAKTLKDLTDVQKARYRVASQKGRITKLENMVTELNHLVKDDILSLTDRAIKYKGNRYTTYETAVKEINKKYNGTAEWGVLQTGSIIDLRAAFIIGEGLKIVKKAEDANAEYDWVMQFLEYNDLDREVVQEFAKEAEIEGKIAIKLALEETPESEKEKKVYMVSTRYVSWTENGYVITANPQDYMRYEKMTWKPKEGDKDEVLKEKEFVYKKFGGRINKPNSATPKIMRCLTQIEDLDKALRDWREIDRIFAGPLLGVECKTAEDRKSVHDALQDKNWKLKKIFIATAKLYYAQFDIKGVESLAEEITMLAKMISGTTGAPVHFLGFPDLMSNRAVADNLMQLVHAATVKERQTWMGAYEEVIAKSIAMYNAKVHPKMSNQTALDPRKIGVEIPMITKDHWLHLEKVLLPAAVAKLISPEAFQQALPGLDLAAEKKRKETKDKSDVERMKKENETLRKDLEDRLAAEGETQAAAGGGE